MTNNQLTAEQLVTLQLRIMSALSFYQQRPEKEAKRMAELLTLAGAATSELQERRESVVVIPSIWKHYSGGKVASLYEQAMNEANVKWRSVDDE